MTADHGMATNYDLDALVSASAGHVARASWTAIIHATGPDATMAAASPKLLAWCAERLEPFCHHRIFVVPHDTTSEVRPVLDELLQGAFKLIGQREALGVGNALQWCQAAVKTPRVIVMALAGTCLTDDAMRACMTFFKQNPDTQLVRPMLEEKDAGALFFKSSSLFRGLTDAGASVLRGLPHPVQGLSPLVSCLDKYPGDVVNVRIKKTDICFA